MAMNCLGDDLDQDILNNKDDISKMCTTSLRLLQNVPNSPEYADFCRVQAAKCFEQGDLNRTAFLLSECHGALLRQQARFRWELQSSYYRKAAMENSSSDPQVKDPLQLKEIRDLKLSKIVPDVDHIDNPATALANRLAEIPPEWTIVQLTVYPDLEYLQRRKGETPRTPGLFLTRWQDGKSLVVKIEPPGLECGGARGILGEVAAILKEESIVTQGQEHLKDRKKYWKARAGHNVRLQAVVNAMGNLWLGVWQHLICGRLIDEDSLSPIVKSVKEECRSLSPFQEYLLSVLLQGPAFISPKAMVAAFLNQGLISSEQAEELPAILRKVMGLKFPDYSVAKRHPVILILDKEIQGLPWECISSLNGQPVSRMPSLAFLHSHWSAMQSSKPVDPSSGYYIINPGADLPGVEERMSKYVSSQRPSWKGVKGREPNSDEISQFLAAEDIMLYCGHGSGSHYISGDTVEKVPCNAVVLLMGCGSGRLYQSGLKTDPTGVSLQYLLAGSPCVIGMLWEVTDIDCDKLTTALIDAWLDEPEGELLNAVAKSRRAATQFVTSAAVIAYGLPVIASTKSKHI